ncbi:glutamate receptor 2.7-like [Ananas comosus]|uniref:Glutamate receptor n=1 Tax=Ananas comosus TaxID=4615 RepID=A0A6P5EJ41_ANACO|nr:glutamate receptor 2.7-like [Ananas comosus]
MSFLERSHLLPSSLILFILSLLSIQQSYLVSPQRPASSPFKVGLILNLDSLVGRMALTSIRIAVDDFYTAHPRSSNHLELLVRKSNDVVTAASAAMELMMKHEVRAILGPQTSIESEFVAELGSKAHVPIVAFSATSPSVSHSHSPYFLRAAANDAAQAAAIADLVSAYGWRRVVPVYEDNDYGSALVPYLIDALNAAGAAVPYRSAIPASASDDYVSAALYRLATEQMRVFVVHMRPDLAARFFPLASDAGMVSAGYVWIITDGLTALLGSGIDAATVAESMQGVLGLAPFTPKSGRVNEFKRKWRRRFSEENPADDVTTAAATSSYALWAYDAAWAVAEAADRLGPVGPEYVGAGTEPTDIANLPVSSTGHELLKLLEEAEFDGLGGEFRLDDGELNVTAFWIVNVIGEGAREIGFWTPQHGLSRRLDGSGEGLAGVIWPGESMVEPKGWDRPTSGAVLRVAVPGPVDVGFHGFLDIETDAATNRTMAGGFVLADVVSYHTLVQQVANGSYDAAVADITITANRSHQVDFTLPYMASGVSMVVAVRDERSTIWVFIKPLKQDLWLVSAAFFILTGAVVWALEHRINDEFRGPPSNQLGTVFYFSLSTLVFAHRENVASNLSKFVVVIWVFVVLILQSSYTASLTSMLTVQKLKPAFVGFDDLKNSGKNVGYLQDSFVKGVLLNRGFDESRLVSFKSPQQYEEALSNGTVAAIVDEIPYLKLVFLKKYCSNYTMVGQLNKTGGFGFAFPKGSPLVSDLSRAILNITESNEVTEIQRKWFGDESTCPSQDNPLSSNQLGFESFAGLFLITGTASLCAFVLHLASFLYKNRYKLRNIASQNSFLPTLRLIAKLFDDKDLSAHTFKRAQPKDGSMKAENRDTGVSPYETYTASPVSMSNYTFEEGRTTPSVEPASSIVFEIEPASPVTETTMHTAGHG